MTIHASVLLNHRRRLALALTVSCGCLGVASEASAYQLESALFGNVRWQNNFANFEIVNANLAPGDIDAINTAKNLWNASPADFHFNISLGDGGFGFPNGENEIVRTDDHWLVDPGGATCQYWFDPFSGHLVEADIMFDDHPSNTHTTAKGNMFAYGGGSRPLATALMHELGHALGLKHEADVYNLMGTDYSMLHANSNTATPFLGADATAGASVLYGWKNNPGYDVTTVHWRRTGVSGEYSTHGRSRLFSTNGAVRPKLGGAEPRYHVQAGSSYQVEFTFENLRYGFWLPVTIAYRLSTNNFLSSGDTFLADHLLLLMPLTSTNVTRTVTIPANVSGDRWVGPVIQAEGVSEVNTSNNATYTGLYVVPANAGGWSYCSPASPCDWGEGDCDIDSDCVAGRHCSFNVGAVYGWDPALDVCE